MLQTDTTIYWNACVQFGAGGRMSWLMVLTLSTWTLLFLIGGKIDWTTFSTDIPMICLMLLLLIPFPSFPWIFRSLPQLIFNYNYIWMIRFIYIYIYIYHIQFTLANELFIVLITAFQGHDTRYENGYKENPIQQFPRVISLLLLCGGNCWLNERSNNGYCPGVCHPCSKCIWCCTISGYRKSTHKHS